LTLQICEIGISALDGAGRKTVECECIASCGGIPKQGGATDIIDDLISGRPAGGKSDGLGKVIVEDPIIRPGQINIIIAMTVAADIPHKSVAAAFNVNHGIAGAEYVVVDEIV